MIRLANEEDVDVIYDLNTELFKVMSEIEESIYNPYGMPKSIILSAIKSSKMDYILCEDDDKVIGYVLLEKASTPSDKIASSTNLETSLFIRLMSGASPLVNL